MEIRRIHESEGDAVGDLWGRMCREIEDGGPFTKQGRRSLSRMLAMSTPKGLGPGSGCSPDPRVRLDHGPSEGPASTARCCPSCSVRISSGCSNTAYRLVMDALDLPHRYKDRDGG